MANHVFQEKEDSTLNDKTEYEDDGEIEGEKMVEMREMKIREEEMMNQSGGDERGGTKPDYYVKTITIISYFIRDNSEIVSLTNYTRCLPPSNSCPPLSSAIFVISWWTFLYSLWFFVIYVRKYTL